MQAARQKRPPHTNRRVRRLKDLVMRQRVLAAMVALDTDTVTKEGQARRLHVAEHAAEQDATGKKRLRCFPRGLVHRRIRSAIPSQSIS